MPGRLIPLVTHEVYHVFNRGIDKRPTFTTKREYQRAYLTLRYYRFVAPRVKLSRFLTLSEFDRINMLTDLEKTHSRWIDLLSFCLMPNHFHFLVRQRAEHGISIFLSQFQNSYTRYFNTRHERQGSLFLDQFKAVRIESEEQLLHVHRYIHLNPYTSFVVKDFDKLFAYPWSSLNEYMNASCDDLCTTTPILSFFKSKEAYKKFLLDQAGYQRQLDSIKHLLLDE